MKSWVFRCTSCPKSSSLAKFYGTLSKEICEELGCDPVPVIAVATHDTASAVVATPAQTNDFVYISCGTWSLFGIESDAPILTDEAMTANFTNETGYNKTTRFLKNIMGLWVIQESRRQWIREGQDVTYATLEQDALAVSRSAALSTVTILRLKRPATCRAVFRNFANAPGNMSRRPAVRSCAAFIRAWR